MSLWRHDIHVSALNNIAIEYKLQLIPLVQLLLCSPGLCHARINGHDLEEQWSVP